MSSQERQQRLLGLLGPGGSLSREEEEEPAHSQSSDWKHWPRKTRESTRLRCRVDPVQDGGRDDFQNADCLHPLPVLLLPIGSSEISGGMQPRWSGA